MKVPNFETFESALVKFAKFLIPFLKAQVSFPSNFASIFSTVKHNSSVLFSSSIIYFCQK